MMKLVGHVAGMGQKKDT